MRMGIVLHRRRRRQMQLVRRRLAIVVLVALLGAAAMSDGLREKLHGAMENGARAAQAFAGGQSARTELVLPERTVYALQLGVFDSGERASSEAQRLERAGVRCMVWQREQMRIISGVAPKREQLALDSAKGHEAYVITDTLQETSVRITADADEMDDVRTLLTLPDSLLDQLMESGAEGLPECIQHTRAMAQAAQQTHPENALYTQLAQSLLNWFALMEATDADSAADYARVTMYALCYELRAAIARQASADSTASAQRTPSTAADVMPPA